MKIVKFVVVTKNIFGRISENIYYPSSNEEYLNFTQNLVDSVDTDFYLESSTDSNAVETICRGLSEETMNHLIIR